MPVHVIQSAFNSGELSPHMLGRVDLTGYQTGAQLIENFLVRPQGGLVRRSGTRYVLNAYSDSVKSRLVPFIFSTEQAYVIEFGDQVCRFFMNEEFILAPTQTFVDGDVSVANNEINIASHYYVDEQGPFQLTTTGTLPAGLALATDYYIVNTGLTGTPATDHIGLSLTAGGAKVNITGAAGGGTHTISDPTETVPNEIVTTYLEAELYDLHFAQSADVLYIAHESHHPATLTRTGHDAWTLADLAPVDGPYLDLRVREVGEAAQASSVQIQTSHTSGSGRTLTATAAVFDATRDIGRMVRLWLGAPLTWGAAQITAVADTTHATVTITKDFGAAATNTSGWHFGAWYVDNYPRTVSFFEQRLTFASTPGEPERFDASVSGGFDDFAPTDVDGTVTSGDLAISYQLAGSGDIQVIKWLNPLRNLLIGTVGGVWPVQASSENEAVTPTNINIPRSNVAGSTSIQPVNSSDVVIYVSRSLKKIWAASYSFDRDAYFPDDLTLLADHITGDGIADLAFQLEPFGIIWAVRTDGVLVALTYERDQKVFAWHRQPIGGTFGAGDAVVESIAVIPSPDGDHDQLWMSVKRTIDGSTERHIEFLEEEFSDSDDTESAFFVDSGVSLDLPVTISGATQADPVVITATSHGIADTSSVRITHVEGMTELNQRSFTINVTGTHTFELVGEDGTGHTAYLSGGEVRKKETSITGTALDHLEGEAVKILADGAVHPDKTVTSSTVTLDRLASEVHIGLEMVSDLKTVPVEMTDRRGTLVGRTRRVTHVTFRLHRTLGLEVGLDADNLVPLLFRSSDDSMDLPPPLYSGLRKHPITLGSDLEGVYYVRQSDPLPATIISAAVEMGVSDK